MFSKVPQSPQPSRAAAAPEVMEIVPIDVRVALEGLRRKSWQP